jgi:hypothetical protein
MSLSRYSWGTNRQERLLDFPCDSVIEGFDDTYYLVPCLINSVPSNGKIKLQLCA